MPDTRNLVLKGRTWWFQCGIPRDLRTQVGRENFLHNLKTGDIKVAQKRRNQAKTAFDRMIREIRVTGQAGTGQDLDELAMRWREDVVSDQSDTISLVLSDEADRIASRHGNDQARRFYSIASGQQTPIQLHVGQHLHEEELAKNTIIERRAHIREFGKWANPAVLEAVDRKLAGQYASERLAHIHPATANKHITALSMYWQWLEKRGHVSIENPWRGQRFKTKKHRDARTLERPFEDGEIVALFSGPPAPRLHDVLAIALLSGLRPSEIIALRIKHCANDLFDITASKTPEGVRQIPIHSALVEIIERRTAGKKLDDLLIHEFEKAVTPGATLSKAFTHYRRKLGIEERVAGQRRSRVNLYSARRWFSQKAIDKGIHDHVVEAVIGHVAKSILFEHYVPNTALSRMRECVEAVQLPTGVVLPAATTKVSAVLPMSQPRVRTKLAFQDS